MSLASQKILKERYEIVRRIKSGGMGAVYEAIDRNLANTACAIKEVLASALQGPDAQYVLQSFESEVRALATLDHPNIPRVRDYFEIDGRRYIVMDLVQGKPLDEELAEHLRVTEQPMDPAVAALDMVVVLETLQYLHHLRPPIVHRDIKPANLIRDQRSGKIKLVDFGIARSVETRSVQTQVGTPGFCAPEQMAGQAEARSDLYSVGATLCYLCTGIQPRAYSFEPMTPDLPDHAGLVAIIKKATAFKAEDRYGDAEQMAQALRRWLRNEKSGHIGANQIPATIRQSAPMPAESPTHDKLLYAIVGLLLCLIGGFFLWVRAQDQATRAQSRPLLLAQASPTPSASPPRLALQNNPKQREAKAKPGPTLPARPKPKPKPQPVARSVQPQIVAPRGPDEATYPTARGSNPAPRNTEPSTTTNNNRPQVQDSIAGFRWTGNVIGAGGVYSKTVDGYNIDIRTHEFPNQTKDQIRDQQGQQMREYPPATIRNHGWCTGRTFSDRHQGWHINDGVMYDIQVRPAHFDAHLMNEVDQFLNAYPSPRM